MQLATSEQNLEWRGLAAARERWLRPAVGFNHPRDVLKDPFLDDTGKARRALVLGVGRLFGQGTAVPAMAARHARSPCPWCDIREAMSKA